MAADIRGLKGKAMASAQRIAEITPDKAMKAAAIKLADRLLAETVLNKDARDATSVAYALQVAALDLANVAQALLRNGVATPNELAELIELAEYADSAAQAVLRPPKPAKPAKEAAPAPAPVTEPAPAAKTSRKGKKPAPAADLSNTTTPSA
jgi:hypothetical protein